MKKRNIAILLTSSIAILTSGIVGFTYGLDTISFNSSTHLQIKENKSDPTPTPDPTPDPDPDPKPDPTPDPDPDPSTGTIDATLTRTYAEKTYLEGSSISSKEYNDRVDFSTSSSNDKNIFELDNSKDKIVPGIYYIASLELKNTGDVSFGYNVKINLNTTESSLSNDLVVYYENNGDHTFIDAPSKKLNEFGSDAIITGTLTKSNLTNFSIKVELPESVTTSQDESVNFDLYVEIWKLS